MKTIIAYDGSTYADAAIGDLPRAGFPRDTEVLIASVVDLSANIPPISEFDLLSAASRRMDSVLARSRQHNVQAFEDTWAMTSTLVDRLRRRFPHWTVHSKILEGEPSDELLRLADEWGADLITGGSHGRSAIGRFFLGSVSKRVAEESRTSVRVVRGGSQRNVDEPVEIIIGAGSVEHARTLVKAVSVRDWPDGARVTLIAYDEGVTSNIVSERKSVYEQLLGPLSGVGAEVSVQVADGDPKNVLLEAADARRADAIFVVAGKGKNRPGLDGTARGLVTAANCPVEIVR